jgi:hypothetical protein
MTCEGPFIWYPCTDGAVLECATCGQVTVTGNWNDLDHAETPVLMEGLR